MVILQFAILVSKKQKNRQLTAVIDGDRVFQHKR